MNVFRAHVVMRGHDRNGSVAAARGGGFERFRLQRGELARDAVGTERARVRAACDGKPRRAGL